LGSHPIAGRSVEAVLISSATSLLISVLGRALSPLRALAHRPAPSAEAALIAPTTAA
jgi:hypothetical protein